MSSERTIHFHVGAHKTATTYIQSRLRSNRQQLLSEGIDFIDLWAGGGAERAYRKKYRRLIEKDDVDDAALSDLSDDLRELVAERARDDHSLIVLSYENILGDFDLSKRGAPYPNAQHAIRHVVRAFSGWKVKVFLSIRSLDRFLESSYVQRVVTRRETRRFAKYLAMIDVESFSWQPLVNSLNDIVGGSNWFAWKYEDFKANESHVWNCFLGHDQSQGVLARPAKRSNPSLSATGLKYMRSINRIATPADARKFRPFVRESFCSLPASKPLSLIDDERRQLLITNYARDLQELEEKFSRNMSIVPDSVVSEDVRAFQ